MVTQDDPNTHAGLPASVNAESLSERGAEASRRSVCERARGWGWSLPVRRLRRSRCFCRLSDRSTGYRS